MKRETYLSHELSLCMVPELRDNARGSRYTRFRYPRFRISADLCQYQSKINNTSVETALLNNVNRGR
jgi:hypothetical protein